MIMRYGLGCRGCGGVFVARMGAQSTNGTRFYLPCPHCTIPIRGQARGQGPEDYVVEFDCDRISIEEIPADTVMVTTNPFVPSRYETDGLQHFGGSGMFALMALLDDDVAIYVRDEGSAQQVIVEMWPHVGRLDEYYRRPQPGRPSCLRSVVPVGAQHVQSRMLRSAGQDALYEFLVVDTECRPQESPRHLRAARRQEGNRHRRRLHAGRPCYRHFSPRAPSRPVEISRNVVDGVSPQPRRGQPKILEGIIEPPDRQPPHAPMNGPVRRGARTVMPGHALGTTYSQLGRVLRLH
ncbi:hypothetical protein ABH924_003917 [Arthrobacter sp. GAS37]